MRLLLLQQEVLSSPHRNQMLEVCLLITTAAVWHTNCINRWCCLVVEWWCWQTASAGGAMTDLFGSKQTQLVNLEQWYNVIEPHLHVGMPHEEWHAACEPCMQARQGSAEVQRKA
ncbi:TPA: hypothetical protein ACH3X1_009359 [Trebouxia sp. C0004]